MSQIYELQRTGKFDLAAQESALLNNNLLLGHLRADRLLRLGRKAPVSELQAWLAAYGDHAEAGAVYALLLRLVPHGQAMPAAPVADTLAPEKLTNNDSGGIDQLDADIPRRPQLETRVMGDVRTGKIDSATSLLAHTPGLSADYRAVLLADMARALFTQNQDGEAFKLASQAWLDDRQYGQPAYLAGLAAWRMGDPATARSWFEASADAPSNTPSMRSGAAFWAARAAQKHQDHQAALAWLNRAAQEKHTFYGLLATRVLGRQVGFDWGKELAGEADMQAIGSTPQGMRAFALLQVGRKDQAEDEFRALWPKLQHWPAMQRALMLVADQAQMTALTAQLAGLVKSADGAVNDMARFPVPVLKPARGFTVDQALVYALTRIESNFQADAASSAGARGLMQLTPLTADFVTSGDRNHHGSLENPGVNLDLGQRYLIYLSGTSGVNADLVRLLASYNAGPTQVAHWNIQDQGDPLLYIESIPVDETRAFVPVALAYSWIYAARFHQPSPSLDALAAGERPQFEARTIQ